MPIDIVKPHYRDLDAARVRVDALAADFAGQFQVRYHWEGERLVFKRTGLRGHVLVDDVNIYLHIVRGPFVPYSEERIRSQAEAFIATHLAPPVPDPEPDTAPSTAETTPEAEPDPEPTVPPSSDTPPAQDHTLFGRLSDLAAGFTSSAIKLAVQTGEVPVKLAEALLNEDDPNYHSDEQRRLMRQTGRYIRQLREKAGLTLDQLAARLELDDLDVLEALEAGQHVPTLELMLSLAAHLAFDDPIPFLIKLTQTYSPDVWRVLEEWGIGPTTLPNEREQQLLALYRNHPTASTLSDEAFETVLNKTRSAFNKAIEYGSD